MDPKHLLWRVRFRSNRWLFRLCACTASTGKWGRWRQEILTGRTLSKLAGLGACNRKSHKAEPQASSCLGWQILVDTAPGPRRGLGQAGSGQDEAGLSKRTGDGKFSQAELRLGWCRRTGTVVAAVPWQAEYNTSASFWAQDTYAMTFEDIMQCEFRKRGQYKISHV